MFANLIVRYYLGLLMYKKFMTGCCFWHILDCMWKRANTYQTDDAEAVTRLRNDPAGSLRNLMLGSASSVMQQTARLTIVVAR
jgi:hypothetical protein